MREIKFRVWSNHEKKYIGEWGIFPHTGGAEQSGPPSGRGMPYVHEQFTGLLDKNGKEIYDGDICKAAGAIIQVIYDRFGVPCLADMARGLSKNTTEFCALFGEKRIKIIGNIHENPELLNAKI